MSVHTDSISLELIWFTFVVRREDEDDDEIDEEDADSLIKLLLFELLMLLLFKFIALDLIEWLVLNEEVDEVDDEADIKSPDFVLLAFWDKKYLE